jgi:hypothetical protein
MPLKCLTKLPQCSYHFVVSQAINRPDRCYDEHQQAFLHALYSYP